MIVKCEVGGNLILNDLNLKLTGGQIKDLAAGYSELEIKKSLRAPNGSLFIALKYNQISVVAKDSKDYREYKKGLDKTIEIEIKENIRNNTRKLFLEYFRMNSFHKNNYIKDLNYLYFDFLCELRTKETEKKHLDRINEKIRDFMDYKIAEGFILI